MLLLCNYYVTYKCNAFCAFCDFANHAKYKDFPIASIEDFKQNIDELAKLGVKFIDLTGGEPLLNKNIAEMAGYAKTKKIQTSITTNTLLYPKYAEALVGKVDLLHFSLDSAKKEIHNKIRNVDCYDRVFESIEIAKSLGEKPDILFTVTNETYTELPEMHKLAKAYNLVLIVNPVFSYFGNPGLNDEALDYVEKYVKYNFDVYLNQSFIKLRKDGGNHVKNPSCKAVSRVIVISPDNKIILPCYHFKNKDIKITSDIVDIMNSEVYKEIKKKEGRFDFCEGCTVNCYFEPSFVFPTNLYSIQSIPSKLKYIFMKRVKQRILKKN